MERLTYLHIKYDQQARSPLQILLDNYFWNYDHSYVECYNMIILNIIYPPLFLNNIKQAITLIVLEWIFFAYI